jgi:putative DNA primase/helicase
MRVAGQTPIATNAQRTREIFNDYLERGWCAIPTPCREKSPGLGSHEAWRSLWERDCWLETRPTSIETVNDGTCWGYLRLRSDDVSLIPEGSNISVNLGEASDGLVDIDLDCPEAVELAERILSPTMTFGRASKPRSHWIYEAPGAVVEQFKYDKATLLELRATPKSKTGMSIGGCQTVFPGSTHTSGEKILWTDGCQSLPTKISPEELRRQVAQLAVACLVKRFSPDSLPAFLADLDVIPEGVAEGVVEKARKWLNLPKQQPSKREAGWLGTSWMNQVRDLGVAAVARAFGAEVEECEGKRPGLRRCPSCQAEQRGYSSNDPRPPAEITSDGGGWNCYRCEAKGSSLDFVSFHLYGRKPEETDWETIREECIKRGLCEKESLPSEGYTALSNEKVARYCKPILDASFVLLRAADGSERLFGFNEDRETTFKIEESDLKKALHDGLKARFEGKIPSRKFIERAIDIWKNETCVIHDEPEPFCFADDESTRYCFKRFKWTVEAGPHDSWEEFTQRLSDAKAFRAFLWSCFVRTNQSRQYLWLHGEGADGKSTVLNIFAELFGPAAAALNNAAIKDARFLNSVIYGKRIVIYPDCKNPRFGMTEHVRNWTGGDHVQVEFKGKTPFSVPMRVKLLIASNSSPEITSQYADTSRLILIEVSRSCNTNDPSWVARLRAELPYFLHHCRLDYAELCPNEGEIRLSDSSKQLREDATASLEERWESIFDASFIAEPNETLPANVVRQEFRESEHPIPSDNDFNAFKAFMERRHGVKLHRSSSGRAYHGIAWKPRVPFSGVKR